MQSLLYRSFKPCVLSRGVQNRAGILLLALRCWFVYVGSQVAKSSRAPGGERGRLMAGR